MKYARTSKRKIIQALSKVILEKLEKNSGDTVTITVKKVVDVLGFDNHATRTEVGKVLARLENLGYFRRCNKGRPAKYLVTGRGLRWVRRGDPYSITSRHALGRCSARRRRESF